MNAALKRLFSPVLPASAVRTLGWLLTLTGVLLLPSSLALSWWREADADADILPLRPEMLVLPAGSFLMGSPSNEEGRFDGEAQHEVKLTRPFAISRTEVTQGMYTRVIGSNPSEPEYKGVVLLGDDLPVQNVSWLEAVQFCNKLSELEGLTVAYRIDGENVAWDQSTNGYRLPTEAEWEYAARAGTTSVWTGTSKGSEACLFGNVADAKAKTKFSLTEADRTFDCSDGWEGLAPVGSFYPNAWGLYDMTGNVWEWTWDRYTEKLTAATDPIGPESGGYRVDRGGSWFDDPQSARVAHRGWRSASNRVGYLGFRLSRSFPSTL